MTPRHRSSIAVPGLLAVALIAAGCQDSTPPTALKRPSFWGGENQCPETKFTGGGRIDPTPPNSMFGKVTFGFNIHGATNCVVSKGEIQVVHHPSQTKYHVSIHDGTDGFGNTPTFSVDGTCITVFATARVKHVNGDWHPHPIGMRACDNGEPGSSPGTGPDTFHWKVMDDDTFGHGDTGETPLTGGNIQQH